MESAQREVSHRSFHLFEYDSAPRSKISVSVSMRRAHAIPMHCYTVPQITPQSLLLGSGEILVVDDKREIIASASDSIEVSNS